MYDHIKALVFIAICIAALVVFSYPQGTDPGGPKRSRPAERPSSPKSPKQQKPEPNRTSRRPIDKRSRGDVTSKSKLASLQITVDTSGSELALYDYLGTEIFFDDQNFAQLSPLAVRITKLRPGRYTLVVKKNGYYDYRESVNVAQAGSTANVRLRPSAGFITITTNVDAPTITIDGTDFSAGFSEIALGSGMHNITVAKFGYETVAKTENVVAGQRRTIQITLDKVKISDLLSLAERKVKDKDYDGVFPLCDAVLKIEPNNSKANLYSGLALSAKGQYSDALEPLFKAITKGETVKFVVARRKSLLFDEALQFGLLEFTGTTISFLNAKSVIPQIDVNGELDFSVPYSKIDTLKIENYYNRYGYAWRVFTKIRVPKENGKDDKKDFAFYTSKASVDRFIPQGQKYYASRIRCDNCLDEAQFIFDLVEALRTGRIPDRPTLKRRG